MVAAMSEQRMSEQSVSRRGLIGAAFSLPVIAAGSPAKAADVSLRDADMADLVESSTSLTRAAIEGTIGRVAAAGRTRRDVIETLDRAEALGEGTVAFFPGGEPYDVGRGISLGGYSVQVQGSGATGSLSEPGGTTFLASSQEGPVLDFTGWVRPESFLGKSTHGGFNVVGSGHSDATKRNSGIRFDRLSSTLFADIAVRNTGGPGIEGVAQAGDAVYLCDFERIIVSTPVDAQVNDVPYWTFNEMNGVRVRGCGIRSIAPTNDCGVSGAVIFTSNSTYSAQSSLIDGFWVEWIHVPSNGTIFAVQANKYVFTDIQFFDAHKLPGATRTSHMRFSAPAVDFGGNLVRGVIPGKGTSDTDLDTGIVMHQSGNAVTGVKGYNGQNVLLMPGVGGTTVELLGAEANASLPGWIDLSGSTSNTLVDHHLGERLYGHREGTYSPSNKIDGVHIGQKAVTYATEIDFTVSYAGANFHVVTIDDSCAWTNVLSGVIGAELTVILRQGTSGGAKLTFPSVVGWKAKPPALPSAPGSRVGVKLAFDGEAWVEL